jgi:hypothetical protein
MLQSHFASSLSQKIRHMRFYLKRKSSTPVTNDQPVAKKSVVSAVMPTTPTSTVESVGDVKSHMAELKKEWAKKPHCRSRGHIKMLLKHTREHRQHLLRNFPKGGIKPILAEFPCFEEAAYVSICYEYKLILQVLFVIVVVNIVNDHFFINDSFNLCIRPS